MTIAVSCRRVLASIAAGACGLGIAYGVERMPQQVDVQPIVSQNFPSYLETGAQDGLVDVPREFCFSVYESTADGVPATIVAAYTLYPLGAVRILQRQGDGSYLAETELRPDQYDLGGGNGCAVGLVDLDGDGRNEIRVSFHPLNAGATIDWYLRWDGTRLTNLLPKPGGC